MCFYYWITSKDRKTSEKCFSRNVLVLLGMLMAYVDWLLSTISSHDQRHSECITSTFRAISPEFDSMYNFRKTSVYAFRFYHRKSILKGNAINKDEESEDLDFLNELNWITVRRSRIYDASNA